ncbi:MAG TPA: hypothetical protein VNS63_18350 [Blastocatellia bacterium]|nr:hypothetical protein [Blastocatellia bacterium]
MAERDKIIKSGQFTIPRLLSLAAIGGLIVAMVALGGIALTIGYWLLTLSICVLLYLIAIDYGIHMDKIDVAGHPAEVAAGAANAPAVATESARVVSAEVRVKRKGNRPAKRRR